MEVTRPVDVHLYEALQLPSPRRSSTRGIMRRASANEAIWQWLLYSGCQRVKTRYSSFMCETSLVSSKQRNTPHHHHHLPRPPHSLYWFGGMVYPCTLLLWQDVCSNRIIDGYEEPQNRLLHEFIQVTCKEGEKTQNLWDDYRLFCAGGVGAKNK